MAERFSLRPFLHRFHRSDSDERGSTHEYPLSSTRPRGAIPPLVHFLQSDTALLSRECPSSRSHRLQLAADGQSPVQCAATRRGAKESEERYRCAYHTTTRPTSHRKLDTRTAPDRRCAVAKEEIGSSRVCYHRQADYNGWALFSNWRVFGRISRRCRHKCGNAPDRGVESGGWT